MKQTIQLRLGQHLTMTPQLQQAIRLLQLSTLDLRAEIQQAVESNPMLEISEEGGENPVSERERQTEGGLGLNREEGDQPVAEGNRSAREQDESAQGVADDMQDSGAAMERSEIPEELPVDSAWDDIYDHPPSASFNTSQEIRGIEDQDNSSETLREHLYWQMRLTPFSEMDMAIAVAIIDAINEHGYLSVPLEEIYEGLLAEGMEIDYAEVEAVLHRIHNFDPLGAGARDLRECMLVQLQQPDPRTPHLDGALRLVRDHLPLLAQRDFTQLMRRMHYSQDKLRQIIDLIQTLNPRPGNLIAGKPPEYIVPDVIVRKVKGAWKVELNTEAMPRVHINSMYAKLVKRADNSSDNTYMRNQLQEARWFIKSLQSRNETLLKVGSCIVKRQRDFLEHGEEAMKALVLHDVAKEVNMHESTISRVTTQKYMHTPRGIFELKYFFSSHVSTAGGGECSATAIRALIKKLISAEDPSKPLSDSKITQILEQQGINIARRTIAKYRESAAIPSSGERKRLS